MAPAQKVLSPNGKPMLSARAAAKKLACAPDYIGRLCREGKLAGVRHQGQWYVEAAAVARFEKERDTAREARAAVLANERREESRAFVYAQKSPIGKAHSHVGHYLSGASALFSAALSKPKQDAPWYLRFARRGALAGLIALFFVIAAPLPAFLIKTLAPAPMIVVLKQDGNSEATSTQPTGSAGTEINNYYSVIERVTETLLTDSRDLVTREFLDTQVERLQDSIAQMDGGGDIGDLEAGDMPDLSSLYLSLAGGTLTGNLSLPSVSANSTSTLAGLVLDGADCSTYGNSGKLTTDALGNVVCADDVAGSGSGTPGGSNTQVQFNDGSNFGGDAAFTFDKVADRLTVTYASTTGITAGYASTTNLFAGSATVSSLSVGSLNGVGLLQNGVLSAVATSSLGLLTTDVAEGSNLYFTNTRVQTYLDTVNKGYFFSTTSADAYIAASTTILKASSLSAGAGINYNPATGVITNTIGYPFPGDATTTQIAFNGGLTTTLASTTNLIISGITNGGTQCLQINSSGTVSGTGSACGSGSGSITSIGPAGQGQTGTSITFATSTSGTDFTVTAAADTITFNLPIASATNTGKLTATDWTVFNNKVSSSSIDTSVELASLVTDETGSGALVFGTNATLSSTTLAGSTLLTNATTTTLGITSIASALLKTNANGSVIPAVPGTDYQNFAYPFPSNATTTSVAFNGGLTATAATITNASTTAFSSSYASSTNLFAGTLTLTNALTVANGGTGSTTLGGLLTGNGTGAVTAATVSGPLSFAANTLSITQANGSTDGYLSSTDWATFNNKISSTSLSSANGLLTYNSSTGVFTASTSPTFTAATTTSLGVTGIASALLKTTATGGVVAAILGTDYQNFAYPFPSNATTTQIDFNGGLTTTYSTTTLNAYFASRVGIGTTSPFATLSIHANNGSTNTMLFAIGSSTANATTTLFSVDNTGLTTVGNSSGTGDAALQLASDANAWTVGYYSGDKSFRIASSTFLTSNVALAILKGGNVGIGTTTPYRQLSVGDSAVFGGDVLAAYFTATSTSVASQFNGGLLSAGSTTINGNATTTGTSYLAGNVGIGGMPTSRALEVTGTARVSSTFSLGTVASCTGSQALQTNGSGDVACGSISVGGASSGGGWQTNSVGEVTLSTTTDRVAIGATTTPYAKLSVLSGAAGTTTLALVPASGATANILDIYNGSGALTSVLTADHKFGIGTTAPSQALSVGGNAYISGGATTTSLGITDITSSLLKTTSTGAVVAAVLGTDYQNFAYPFPSNATTTLIAFNSGLTTAGFLSTASSTINGNLVITGNSTTTNATTTALAISSVTSSLLKTNSNGSVVPAILGTDYQAAGNYLTALGNYSTTTATAISISTSTAVFNGLTLGNTFVVSSNNILVTPTISGTLTVGGGGTGSTSLGAILAGGGSSIYSVATGTVSASNGLTVTAGQYIIGSGLTITGTNAAADGSTKGVSTYTAADFNDNASGLISIDYTNGQKATGSVPGFLSSADWTTFNNKISSTSLSSANGLLTYNSSTGVFTASTSPTFTAATTTSLGITGLSNVLLKTTSTGGVVAAVLGTDYQNFAYPFPSNATTTQIDFNGGLTAYASTTIGAGGQTTGLTISGGATTTGTAVVQGIIKNSDGSASAPSYGFTSDTTTGTYINGSTLSFSANGALRLSLDGSSGAIVSGGGQFRGTGGSASGPGYAFSSGTNTGLYSDNGLGLSTSGISRLHILSTGEVGIGTTSPYAKLSVVGQTVAEYFTATSTTVASTFPYASTTMLTATTASTTNLNISGIPNAVLKTVNGVVTAAVPGTDYQNFTYPFPSNATTTQIAFNGGLTATAATLTNASTTAFSSSYASSTNLFAGNLTLTNALTVINGGTGSTTLGGILTGNGTGAVTAAAVSAPLSFAANTLSISQATVSTNGYLSSTDWNIFNNKISSTSLSATFPLAYNSATGAFTFNGLSTSTAAVVGNIPYFSSANTFANVATGTISGSTGISVTAGQYIIGSGLTITNTGVTSLTAGAGIAVSAATGAVTVTNSIGYPFPANATTTSIAFNGGLTTAGFLSTASSTVNGDLIITGNSTTTNATTTALAISSITSSLLKTNSSGGVIAAIAGTDYLTSADIFAYPFPSNATTTLLAFNGGLTTTNATSTTLFSGRLTSNTAAFGGSASTTISSTGALSTPSLTIGSLSGLIAGSAGLTYATATGTVSSGAGISVTGSQYIIGSGLTITNTIGYPFTTLTTFGTTTSATSSSIYTAGAFFASSTVTASQFPYASTTALTVSGSLYGAGLTTCNTSSDKLLWNNGQFSCGLDQTGGGGSDSNWTFFNGSGIRPATSTNQVLIGATATSSLYKLQVVGGAIFDTASTTQLSASIAYFGGTATTTIDSAGQVGIGTSSPSAKLAVAGGNILQVASGNPTLASSTTTSSKVYATAVMGRLAYIAEYGNGLKILDVTNPRAPKTVGSVGSIGNAVSVAVAGRYAYVGTESSVKIIDVANPAAPVVVGTYSGLDFAYSIALSGKYLFATDDSDGLRILDISDPANPTLAGTYAIAGNPYALAVSGRYAYIGDQGNGDTYIVDISNPAAPSLVGTYNGSVAPAAYYHSGKYLYVGDSGGGFYILDVASAASPTLVGTYNASGVYYGVAVAGNYAYLADFASALTVVDVTDPANITLVGSYTTASTPWTVTVSGKYAYVADNTAGLKILDINGATFPAANIGSIESNSINVSDNLVVGNDITAGGSLNVGISGIMSRGTISAYIASSTQVNPVVANFMGGNVGIGTTSPSQALSVSGSALISGGATTTSLGILGITNSLLMTNASGTVRALTASAQLAALLTDETGTAGSLVFSGAPTLTGTTSLASATFTGEINMPSVVRIYRNDGAFLTANSSDLALGAFALQNYQGLALAQSQTAIGESALGNLISGAYNVAVGAQALANNTVATGTVAVGYGAGSGGGVGNFTGGTYVGYFAGQSANGDYNTFLGYQAGVNGIAGVGGYSNILLGASTELTNLTTGSGNIGIGGNIFFASGTANSQLNIGGLIFGSLPATSTNFRLPTTGAIGIGTSSPFATLSIHANNGSTNTMLFAIGSSTANATTTLFSVDNTGLTTVGNSSGTGDAALQLASDANAWTVGYYSGDKSFRIASSTFLTSNVALAILKGGNVGIGTTTPFARLAVSGTGIGTGVNFQTADSAHLPNFTVLDNGAVNIGTTTATSIANTLALRHFNDSGVSRDASTFTFLDAGDISAGVRSRSVQNLTLTASGAINAATLSTRGSLNTVTYSGTLANGTSATLNLRGQENAVTFSGTTNSGNTARVTGSYNTVGGDMGTTADLAQHIGVYASVSGTAHNNYGLYINNVSDADNNYAVYSAAAVQSYFAGNVNTDGTTGGYMIDGILILQASSTLSSLAVGQQALNNSYIGMDNVAVGQASMTSLTSGFENTAVGNRSLNANTTGSQNVAFGVALEFNTTGASNAAFGSGALRLNTTGSSNVAVGPSALRSNTSATSSVAVGQGAGAGSGPYSNQGSALLGYLAGTSFQTGSDYNTLVGYRAGWGITTGSNNIWIGTATSSTSVANLTTGSQNILIGNNISLPSATDSGQLNIGNMIYGTGIMGTVSTVSTGKIGIGTTTPGSTLSVAGAGYFAGHVNLDQFSAYKIAGNTALYASSTLGSVYIGNAGPTAYNSGATNNTLLGRNAGNLITSGANNVLLGAWSTAANSNLTSGSNNILLGYNISLPSATQNGQLNIQNILYGSGNNTGTGQTYSTGKLGIGSTTPMARLSIHANNGDANRLLFAIGSSTASATTTLFTIDNTGSISANAVIPNGSYTNNLSAYDLGSTGARWNALWAGTVNIGTSTFSLAANSASGLGIYNAASGGGTQVMTITTGGNVGIGTTTPTQQLTIGNGGIRINRDSSEPFVQFSALGADLAQIRGISGGGLRFTGGGGSPEWARFDSAGNVGIGTTTPWARLSADTTSLGANVPSFVVGSSTRTDLIVTQAGNVGIGTTTPTQLLHLATQSIGGGITINGAVTGASPALVLAATSTQKSALGLALVAGHFSNVAGMYDTVLRSDAGNLILAAKNATGNVYLSTGSTDSAKLTVTNAGNVGVGTSTPQAKLSVSGGDDNFWGQLSVFSTGNDARIEFRNSNGLTATGNGSILMSKSGGFEGMRFMIGGADKMILDENGNVGLGTTAPNSKLDVNGIITMAGGGAGSWLVGDNLDGTHANTWMVRSINNGKQFGMSYTTGDMFLAMNGGDVEIGGGSSSRLTVFNSGAQPTVQLINDQTNQASILADAASNSYAGVNIRSGVYASASSGYFFFQGMSDLDGSPDNEFLLRGDGTGLADVSWNGGGADYAEYVTPAPGTFSADYPKGSLICLIESDPDTYGYCDSANDSRVIGVISTMPALVGNSPAETKESFEERERTHILMSMLGRVPLRVSLEGGPIRIGDHLTASSEEGVAMKATTTTRTIGIALDNHTSSSATTSIMVYIEPELTIIDSEINALAQMTLFASSTIASSTPVAGSFMDNFLRGVFAYVSQKLADAGNGIAQIFAQTITAEVVNADTVNTNELCIEGVCINKQQLEDILSGQNSGGGGGEEPPAQEPPADEPPAQEPPAEEPPAEEPPADEPPADEPPADEPPPETP